MIGNSTFEYVWVVSWASILHSISPVCVLYCILAACLSKLPRYPLYLAIPETIFYVLTHFYRKHHIQRPAAHPPLASREERDDLFDRCLDTTPDVEQYISKWFLDAPLSDIRRENVKEFFRWAFLNADAADPDYDDEVESYVKKLEGRIGREFRPGRSDVKSLRLTLDKVNALHRSLIWYMVRTSPLHKEDTNTRIW